MKSRTPLNASVASGCEQSLRACMRDILAPQIVEKHALINCARVELLTCPYVRDCAPRSFAK
jgi:hypothetical protein